MILTFPQPCGIESFLERNLNYICINMQVYAYIIILNSNLCSDIDSVPIPYYFFLWKEKLANMNLLGNNTELS